MSKIVEVYANTYISTIKEFALGTTAEIIASSAESNITYDRYKYQMLAACTTPETKPRLCLMGNHAAQNSVGIGSMDYNTPVDNLYGHIGYRTVSLAK